MFIFLSKFAPLFVYPLGFASLLLLVGLIFWKGRKFAFYSVLFAFLLLFLASNRYIALSFARTLEWQYIPSGTLPQADLIVVLGGATEPQLPPRPAVELNAAADRLFYAGKLYQDGIAPRVLLSGGDIEFLSMSDKTPAQDMAQVMELLGVPESALVLQGKSQNTHEDALYSCQWIKDHGVKSVILVTSATHMPRSVKTFEKQGCQVIPAPADFSVTEESWQRLWHPNFEEFLINLVPNYSNLSLTTKTLKEYFGLWVYGLRGWL